MGKAKRLRAERLAATRDSVPSRREELPICQCPWQVGPHVETDKCRRYWAWAAGIADARVT